MFIYQEYPQIEGYIYNFLKPTDSCTIRSEPYRMLYMKYALFVLYQNPFTHKCDVQKVLSISPHNTRYLDNNKRFVKKESFVKGLNLYTGPIDLLEKNNFVRKCLQMHLIKALTKIWKGSCHTCINVFNKLVRFCQRDFGKSPLKTADKWVCLESPTHCVHCEQ